MEISSAEFGSSTIRFTIVAGLKIISLRQMEFGFSLMEISVMGSIPKL
jgi:hypothetical protein